MAIKQYMVTLDQSDVEQFDKLVGHSKRSEKLRELIKEFLKKEKEGEKK